MELMKKIMNKLFLSCLRASELIEKKLHFKLSITEKLQLKVHKSMCKACTLYEKQSVFIEKGISNMNQNTYPKIDIEGLKKQIVERLEQLNKS